MVDLVLETMLRGYQFAKMLIFGRFDIDHRSATHTGVRMDRITINTLWLEVVLLGLWLAWVRVSVARIRGVGFGPFR